MTLICILFVVIMLIMFAAIFAVIFEVNFDITKEKYVVMWYTEYDNETETKIRKFVKLFKL